MTKISVFLAQASAAAPAPTGMDAFKGMLPIILMFGAMYFLLIAPQRKKQKQHEAMMNSLKVGDEVVTSGGIYGVITSVKDDRFTIRIGSDNAKIDVKKGFISELLKKADQAS